MIQEWLCIDKNYNLTNGNILLQYRYYCRLPTALFVSVQFQFIILLRLRFKNQRTMFNNYYQWTMWQLNSSLPVSAHAPDLFILIGVFLREEHPYPYHSHAKLRNVDNALQIINKSWKTDCLKVRWINPFYWQLSISVAFNIQIFTDKNVNYLFTYLYFVSWEDNQKS